METLKPVLVDSQEDPTEALKQRKLVKRDNLLIAGPWWSPQLAAEKSVGRPDVVSCAMVHSVHAVFCSSFSL